jgi:hypothetical protein
METNFFVVRAEPFGLDDRRDILAKIRFQGGRQKILSEKFGAGLGIDGYATGPNILFSLR